MITLLAGVGASVRAQDIMPEPTPTPSPTAPTPTPIVVPIDAAHVSASTSDSHVPANTVDGDLATRWSGYGDGAWLELDLGRIARVTEVRIAVHQGNTRKNALDLLVSDDHTSWTTAWSGETSGTTTALQAVRLSHYGRYVRYVGHGYVTNTGGQGLWNSVSEVQIASPQLSTVPVPQNLTASTIFDAGMIYLQWAPASGVAVYNVYSREAGTGWRLLTSTSATTYTNSGLRDGVRYCYAVTSRLFPNESFFSDPACAVGSVMPLPPPPPPANLKATPGTVGCDGYLATPLRLSWDPSPGATSYGVFKSGAPGGPYEKIATVTTTQHDIGTISFGYYVVNAVADPTRVSRYSNEVFGTFIIPGCPAPLDITPPASGVTASTDDGNVAANAVDRNLQTRWSGYGDGAWLQLDLGRIRVVASAQIAVHRGDTRQNQFEIQISSDLVTWTPLFSGQSALGLGLQPFNLVDKSGRYVRYVGHGSSDPDKRLWNSVAELRLFGY
jgi:hypothetical protein